MKKPNITPGKWTIGESETGPAVFGDSHIEGVKVVVAKGSGWDMDNKPTNSHEANLVAIAALPSILDAIELLMSGCEQAQKKGLQQPQINGGMVLAGAALTKAGYTF